MKPQVVAFHLPQFHRIPENDAWWGDGYTEWTKVRAARPLFPGHRQPRVPLGRQYYDLLDAQAHARQQALAQEHGISAFCYYHYWFKGRELLEKPLDLVLATPSLELPFCLAWANEPWTRAWDGSTSTVLMAQDYGTAEDWKAHIQRLIPFFKDPRYLHIDGRPVFPIYRTSAIEALQAMLACWSQALKAVGLPPVYLISLETGFEQDRRQALFDARADFEPMHTLQHRMGAAHLLLRKLRTIKYLASKADLAEPFVRRREDYAAIWKRILARPAKPQHFLGAFPDWDNSPRKGLASVVVDGASPERFGHYLSKQYERATAAGHPLLFLNAWNEWSEGAYIEPDEHHGGAWLSAIQHVTSGYGERNL